MPWLLAGGADVGQAWLLLFFRCMPNLCAASAVDTVKRRCPAARRSQLVYYVNLLRLTKCICNLVEASKCLDNLIKIALKAAVRVCATYTHVHRHTYIHT